MLYPKKQSFLFILLPIGLFLLLLGACQKDSADFLMVEEPIIETGPKSFPGVDTALWPYFERFEEIAAAQGIPIDLIGEKITGVIEDLEEDRVAGLCTYYSHGPNHVVVDTEFWQQSNENFKEMIVFHELGHCVLDRDHREGQLDNGACISIMRSGVEPCRDTYNTATKSYYWEELFHPERVN